MQKSWQDLFFFILSENSEAVQSVVKVVLKDLSKFTEKHLNGSLFFDEVATTFLKRKCSAVFFLWILKNF